MKKNNVIDLFCGAGGLSLGFEKAGFNPVLAIDFWGPAIETYNNNRKNKVGQVQDITKLDKKYFEQFDINELAGVIGGPPCQGFSLAGKRVIDDDRNKLYRDYFRILEILKPKFFLMENVVGLMNLNGGAIKEDIIRRANLIGYHVSYKILCASDYGVPQNRRRVFFIGIRDDIFLKKGVFAFPSPKDYKVSCIEALSDLPNLDMGQDKTKYFGEPQNDYQKIMREKSLIVHNHEQSKHSDETKKAISYVPQGGGMKDIPVEIRGNRKYSSLLRRMDSSKPSQTVDTGHRTYFHYNENRVISVREAARLQSFPDDYIFYTGKQNQYKQVGNAVPPILAYELAKAIINYFGK